MSLFGAALPASRHRLGETLEAARTAEELGADLVTVADHPYLPDELETPALLGLLAGHTERVLLAPNVTPLALRPPALLAKTAATLQVISGGRFVLGLGAGGADERAVGFGGRPPSVAALDEAVPLIRRLWSGAPVDHEGPHFRLVQAEVAAPPRPVPIWVGAFKPRMLALTGRHADGWLPTNAYLDLADVPEMQRRVDRAATDAGRDPAEIRRVFNVMGTISDEIPPRNDRKLNGPVQQWVTALRDYRARLRFDSIVFWPVRGDVRDQVRRFFEEVRPHLI
ncbi:LLM class flavin-dependent oxidoreductase [Phytohabitans sp. LJ34]|uniref:LLM class flavin-dependent oxidoreductase n=1 Tax=Phytohabitans sp. LJ34 TaxID=3452217 RepID=UPI003F899413